MTSARWASCRRRASNDTNYETSGENIKVTFVSTGGSKGGGARDACPLPHNPISFNACFRGKNGHGTALNPF